MRVGTSKITSKGQLTIPLDIRKSKKLESGTSVIITETDSGILIKRSDDLKDFFVPFQEMAKKAKVTREQLQRWTDVEKKRTLKRFES